MKAEEIRELLAPGSPILCEPWIKPLSVYGLRIETTNASGSRFG